MSLDPAQLIALTRGLVHNDPRERWTSANEVTDLRTELGVGQQHCLAFLLAELALWEADGLAREAQLHVLAELHEWNGVPAEAIEVVRLIDPSSLIGSEVEYVAWLTGAQA
jgi:hypothetical protein